MDAWRKCPTKLGPRCLWRGSLPGCAGPLGPQRRVLQSWDLGLWRVDPACLGDGPLGAQRRDPHRAGTYTSEEWSLPGCAGLGTQVVSP